MLMSALTGSNPFSEEAPSLPARIAARRPLTSLQPLIDLFSKRKGRIDRQVAKASERSTSSQAGWDERLLQVPGQ
jgi:hypothetical protein